MQSLKGDQETPRMEHSALADVPEVSTRGLSGSALRNANKGAGTVNGSADIAGGTGSSGDDFSDIELGPRAKGPSTPAWEQVGGVGVNAPVIGGAAGTLNAHDQAFTDGPAFEPNAYKEPEFDQSHYGEGGPMTFMSGVGEQSERSTLGTLPEEGNKRRHEADARIAESMGIQTPNTDGALDPSALVAKVQARRDTGQPFGAPTPEAPEPAQPQYQPPRMTM
ncbi:MAG: hypothetical protein AAF556_00495 [Pseudomonadota bacterium]